MLFLRHTYLLGNLVNVGLGLAVQFVEHTVEEGQHLTDVSVLVECTSVKHISSALLGAVLAVKVDRVAKLVDLFGREFWFCLVHISLIPAFTFTSAFPNGIRFS